MRDLEALGWTDDRAAEFAALGADVSPARIVVELRGQPQVSDGGAPFAAELGGGLRHRAGAGQRPAIGDWVALRRSDGGPATILEVLPRRSALLRIAASGRPQVLAANVDLAAIVMGLDGDFNPRRLERYLTLCASAGVAAVVMLSKADLCPEAVARTATIRALAGATPVTALDVRGDDGPAWLAPRLGRGRTLVLLGSSGAGKSTLTNRLLGGEVQRTQGVRRHDDRGLHTTTHRQLFALPSGALVIDTPGLRTLALTEDGGAGPAFDDVEAIAVRCQFRDCRHDREPGCAVVAAVASGELPAARLANFAKLRAERAGAPSSTRPPRRGR